MARQRMGLVWTFKTKRFVVSLRLEREERYQYDGEDENGETQAKLDAGEYVAFTSEVTVSLDGEAIGSDFLGGSVYEAGSFSDFWTEHRTSSFEYRNTLALKARNAAICHYFPDMVSIAVKEARKAISAKRKACAALPVMREVQ